MANIYIYISWLLVNLFLPISVRAQTVDLENPLGEFNNILQGGSFVGLIIARVLAIVGALSLLMLIYGGLTMISAGGNDTKVNQGKAIVTYTAIGLVVIFTAYAIVKFGALIFYPMSFEDEYSQWTPYED